MRRLALPLLGCLVALALACGGRPAATDEGGERVVAKVGGQPITQSELDTWIKDQLFDEATDNREESKLHEVRSENLERLISERLLEQEAKARGVDVDAMLEQEAAKRVQVTDAEVSEFYERNKAGLQGRTFDSLRDQIRQHLERQAGWKVSQELLAELRSKANVETLLEVPRADVPTDGPTVGPADAPVTLVEFSDYQCPFCSRAEPTVRELLKQYEGKVRLVYKHFPLDSIHPLARGAAIAAHCAGQQGKFWEYHEQLWAQPQDLKPESLTAKARAAQLDVAAFGTCQQDPASSKAVDADVAQARAAGVSSTPTFFVNGIRLKGARSLEDFRSLIDQELAAAAKAEKKG